MVYVIYKIQLIYVYIYYNIEYSIIYIFNIYIYIST
jgi:hypothetical protein